MLCKGKCDTVTKFVFNIDDENNANFGLFICIQTALHVSGDVFTHHQEYLIVFTAYDIVHLCCCLPVSWTRWKSFHLVHDIGRQQLRWTIS